MRKTKHFVGEVINEWELVELIREGNRTYWKAKCPSCRSIVEAIPSRLKNQKKCRCCGVALSGRAKSPGKARTVLKIDSAGAVIERYESGMAAARVIGGNTGPTASCINKAAATRGARTAYGYRWAFEDDWLASGASLNPKKIEIAFTRYEQLLEIEKRFLEQEEVKKQNPMP